ncbi:MAG TPA: GNAT family N-acetyltransferase [Microlunatus sp.]
MQLRPFTADQEADLQELLESDPGYAERVTGYPPMPSDALSLTVVRPDGFELKSKHVLGGWHPGWAGRDELASVVDLLRGYPAADCAFVGLLLVRFELQGTGLGRQTWQEVEGLVSGWPEIRRFRLAVVETNARTALPFWRALGFRETGERQPHQVLEEPASAILMEKAIGSRSAVG